MNLRHKALLTLTAGLVTLAVVIPHVLADEPFGVITHVALEGRKVSFHTKAGEKLELDITDSTEIVDAMREKISLETVAAAVSKAIKDGTEGVLARVTFDKKVVSKITVGLPKKKKPK